MPELRIGVLAVQGGFEAHLGMLRELGADAREVRTPEDLRDLDGLVIPGGESTTIVKGIESIGLEAAIRAHHEAVFIRAPRVERYGAGVEVLASYDGRPVAVREGSVLACAFHPELTDDPRLHALFMAMTTSARCGVCEEAER